LTWEAKAERLLERYGEALTDLCSECVQAPSCMDARADCPIYRLMRATERQLNAIRSKGGERR